MRYGKQFVFGAAIAAASFAFGGELPPAIAPADFALGNEAGWLWSILALPEAKAVILGFISVAAGMLVRWRVVVSWRLERAVQCLAAGVRETYEEYVRAAQKANGDGKLTQEERDHAMRLALEKAKAYALREGVDLAKAYAKEYLPVVVERLIGVQKASGRGLPLAPLLPELGLRRR